MRKKTDERKIHGDTLKAKQKIGKRERQVIHS